MVDQKTKHNDGTFLTIEGIDALPKAERVNFLVTHSANAATWDEWHNKMQEKEPARTHVEAQIVVCLDRTKLGLTVRGCDIGLKLDASWELEALQRHYIDPDSTVRRASLRMEWMSRNWYGQQLTGSEADDYMKGLRRKKILKELSGILDAYKWQNPV